MPSRISYLTKHSPMAMGGRPAIRQPPAGACGNVFHCVAARSEAAFRRPLVAHKSGQPDQSSVSFRSIWSLVWTERELISKARCAVIRSTSSSVTLTLEFSRKPWLVVPSALVPG